MVQHYKTIRNFPVIRFIGSVDYELGLRALNLSFTPDDTGTSIALMGATLGTSCYIKVATAAVDAFSRIR